MNFCKRYGYIRLLKDGMVKKGFIKKFVRKGHEMVEGGWGLYVRQTNTSKNIASCSLWVFWENKLKTEAWKTSKMIGSAKMGNLGGEARLKMGVGTDDQLR